MRTAGIVGIALLCLFVGQIVGYSFLPPETIFVDRVEVVEIPVEKIVEKVIYRVQPLEQFDSVYDLQEWLYNNDISERQYIPTTYDCDDFAVDLVRAARADGYEIFICATDDHMFNMCEIQGLWYIIEPQTDEVWYVGPEL